MNQAKIHHINEGQQAMPSKNGFVTVWRDIQKQPWYKSPEHVAVFLHILTSATHQLQGLMRISQTPTMQVDLLPPVLEKST